MNLSLGIVGLPNVGKSTLFNALTKNNVPAENYPFCTIDPNHGVVPVFDDRLDRLAEIESPEKVVPAVIEFVDIAGIIAGAHKGEGLGNKFLSHIREVNALVHVVRNFENNSIVHVNNKISPIDDINTINTELILKDIETVEQRKAKIQKELKNDKNADLINEWINAFLKHLSDGKTANSFEQRNEDIIKQYRKELHLLTDKPIIYLVNSSEKKEDSVVRKELGLSENEVIMQMDIKVEFEIFMLENEERKEFMEMMGIDEPGLYKLTRLSYKILELISFFTSGKKEVKAWTINKGFTAPQAAGTIHNDFEQKFIAADVVSFEDFSKFDGWLGARNSGKVRLEGKEYVVQDGDVMIFKHGA